MQQHGRKYFSRRPPIANYWDWGQNSTFSEYGNVAFQREWRMQQHGNILPADPGGKGQNSTFSEYGHVAYHIKGNDACSMVANILPADPPQPWGWGQNSFSEHAHVAYQIKWNHIYSSNVQAHIVLTCTLGPWGGVKC